MLRVAGRRFAPLSWKPNPAATFFYNRNPVIGSYTSDDSRSFSAPPTRFTREYGFLWARRGFASKTLAPRRQDMGLSDLPLAHVLETCRISSNLAKTMEAHARIIKSGLDAHGTLAGSLIRVYVIHDHLWEAQLLFDGIQEWDFDPIPANLIIASYLQKGEFDKANQVFSAMPVKDLVSWNSMIAGCAKSSNPREAISFFHCMLSLGVEPDGFTFSSILSACARVGALSHGEWVHRLMVEKEVRLNYIIGSALIDMYSKCGRIDMGRRIYTLVPKGDVSIWNSMITGLAIHGLGAEAIEVFSRMEEEGIMPDNISFVGILTACSHCGLVKEGRHHFDLMKPKYSIEPQMEHYGAIVDLLARKGLLEEAYATIKAMPMEPDIVIWRALLSACREYQDPRLGEVVIGQMEHVGSGDYVLLSSIYSSAKRWNCAERVWNQMKDKKIRKDCGLSWVEIGGKIHEFKAGDNSHIDSERIYQVLYGLMRRVKADGFVHMTAIVAMDVLEEEKERNLLCHSEKLAIAYGVLKTVPGMEIRVSKNLRMCCDCHSWIKMVSRAVSRVIIVRDRIRFHRFESGSCSCQEYW